MVEQAGTGMDWQAHNNHPYQNNIYKIAQKISKQSKKMPMRKNELTQIIGA